MARKKPSAKTANWLDEATEVPRAEVVANKDRGKAQRRYRLYIRAAIILLPIALLTILVLVGSLLRPAVATGDDGQTPTAGKAAAILEMESWLGGDPAPLPEPARVLSWDGFEVIERPVQSEQEATRNPLPAWELELHQFTVSDGLGVLYDATVQVAVGEGLGAMAISTPSVLPRPLADANALSGATPWFGLGQASVPAPVTTAINAWAAAFTSGDPDALRLAIQDDDGSRSYVPFYNVRSYEIASGAAAQLPESDPDAEPTRMLVQVELAVQWAGSPTPEAGARIPRITFDLLVLNANTAAPVIVAWGAGGSGPSLEPYSNAVTGRAIAAPDAPDFEEPQPGQTDGPTGTPTTAPSSPTSPTTPSNPNVGPTTPALPGDEDVQG